MPGPGSPDTGRADGFDVVPAALRGAAGTFASEADALHAATQSLQRHLSTLGAAPWGADAVGARFGASYQPAAQAVATNLGALIVGLGRISGALGAVADRYEQADAFAVPMPPVDTSEPPSPSPSQSPSTGRRRSGDSRSSRTGDAAVPRRSYVTGRRP